MDINKNLDQYRPVPFYFLTTTDPAAYTEDAVMKAMTLCKEQGFGGIVLFNKPPHGFDSKTYLSDYWFEVTERFIKAARELDLQLWINDGFNYPPGDAAGRIMEVAPELKQHRLRVNDEGKLDVVEVPWGFPAFEEPESSKWFIHFVYEQYYQRLGKYFGNGITGFFSDADNRRVNSSDLKKLDCSYYPWSRNFAAIFEKRFGYKVEEHLKELFSGSDANVVRDYWRLCGDLYQQWFANNFNWCREHNVRYTFHTSDTGPLRRGDCARSSLFTEGDPLTLLAYSDAPGTDHEIFVLDGGTHYDKRLFTPRVTWAGDTAQMQHPALNDTAMDIRAKYAGSAAYLNGRKRCMCEMFAATNWGATFNDLRRIAAWQIMQGVNFIVPHAVHHRLCGEVKHFAPPEFSRSTLSSGVRKFNDMLAKYCQAAAAGELVAEYAVIDPSPRVWQDQDPAPFFAFCDKLNRRPEGYVIVPENYAGPIKNIIDPLKSVPELPEPQIRFTGGEICCMRRMLDGQEYLLCGNIWSETPLAGTLYYQGKQYELVLEPGEIAIVGGPFESYRTPEKRSVKHRFAGTYPVRWAEVQQLPFEKKLQFTAKESMKLTLLLPQEAGCTAVINGKTMTASAETLVFDDPYRSLEFTARAGENEIILDQAAPFTTPALLAGAFDAETATSGDYARQVFYEYQLALFEPEEKKITLSCRRDTLALNCGWEKQGQPFYSGAAVISLGEYDSDSADQLELPGYAGVAELFIDGQAAERLAYSPYSFALPAGRHQLELKLWNTFANRMERYAAPSGLDQEPVITGR